jgi:hypothetical protein
LATTTIRQGLDEITPEELDHIQQVVKRFPKLSRSVLAETLCEHLQWYSPSGALKRQKGMQVLACLAEQGLSVPPLRCTRGRCSDKPIQLTERTREHEPLKGTLKELPAVELMLVHSKPIIALWNEYVQRYHPLGYRRPFGNWLRYFIQADNKRLGCLLISGAAKALHHRDQWIGWNQALRRRNLPWVINNSRYLLFPWVQVPHLASHVLGQLARRVAHDWEQRWGYRPVLMETFVDPTYNGTCYRAAGWEALGMTRGKGILRPGKQYTTTPKHIFAKPLHPQFQSLLTSEQLQGRIIE